MSVGISCFGDCWINLPPWMRLQLSQESLEKLNKALEMQWMLSNSQFLEHLPYRILEFISGIINANHYEMYLRDFRKVNLQLVSARGFSGLITQIQQGKKTIADLVFENEKTLNIPDLNEYPEIYRYPYGPSVRSVLSTPIRTPSEILGVVQVASCEANKFSIEDCMFLNILVKMVAVLVKTSMIVLEDINARIRNGLTGLLSYQTFRELLDQEIERARRTRQVLALMTINLNNWEKFTDEAPAGRINYSWRDYALKELSRIIRSNVREYDLICRYGESKLMVALPQLDRLSATVVAERLRSSIEELPLKCYDQPSASEVHLHPNIGVAFCPDDAEESYTLVKMARGALRESRETNQTVLSQGAEMERTLPVEFFHVKTQPLISVKPWDILMKDFLWLSLVIMAETLKAERASLATVVEGNSESSSDQRLRIECARGINEVAMSETIAIAPANAGILGEVIRTGKPVLVEDIEKDPRFQRANKDGYKTKSFICVPITPAYAGEIIGIVALADKESGGSFTEADLNLATSLATQIGRAVVDRKMVYVDAIAEMLSIAQDTLSYWKGHSKRVAKYARQIADFLGLGEKRAEHIEKSGLLHDLGDIKLAPYIFSKQGRLNQAEKEQVRQRSEISQRIFRSVCFLRPYEEDVAYLRKIENGNGEIPDSARILAISEAFDAMTSDRPHRSRMAPQEAIDELSRNVKTWFDEQIIGALRGVLDAGTVAS